MRISDWSSDVCSSDLAQEGEIGRRHQFGKGRRLGQSGRRRFATGLPARLLQRVEFAPVDGFGPGRVGALAVALHANRPRSEEHTSELQSLMRISYAVLCLKKKNRLASTT